VTLESAAAAGAPSAPPAAAPAPIFIVGCQRSGTTLLRLMLDAHPRISCGPESRFLPDLARITRDDWPRMSRYGLPREEWHERVAEFFDGFQREYAEQRGKVRWADKSPRYAMSLDYIAEVFPNCQVLHVIRDGRDVVASHRRRWGYASAVRATVKWPRYVAFARDVGAALGPDRYLEVRYEDLVSEPRETAARVLAFLGEPWDDAVLAYDTRPHDVSPHYAELTARRRQEARQEGAVYRNRVGAHRSELGPVLGTLTSVAQRRALRELGYR
jgi:hypothetical protein